MFERHGAQLDGQCNFCGCAYGFLPGLFLAQEVHRTFAEYVVEGFTEDDCVVERKPSPVLSGDGDCALMIYADNSHHFVLGADIVNRMRESVSGALNGHALKTHEVLEGSHVAEALGARADMQAGILASTAEHSGRVRGALE